MRLGRLKVACCALALAVACGREAELGPAPLGPIRLPTGLAVDGQGRLIVASSNADLLYAESTGGTVTVLDPLDPATLSSIELTSAVTVRSFAGDLAFARTEPWGAPVPDAEACGTAIGSQPLAVFGTRGSNTLNVLVEDPAGQLSCAGCSMPVGSGHADPLPVTIACGGARPRAFVGYLTSGGGAAWIGELDLVTLGLQNFSIGVGPPRGLAYDRDRDRLYVAGLELRSIAFAHRLPLVPLRAYITARIYDTTTAATAGGRTTDLGGLLIVVDLVDTAIGGVDPQVVAAVPIGRGAQDVRVLPRAKGWSASRRDVIAVLTVDEGALWIYDDESGSLQAIRQCATAEVCTPVTGAPILGHEPYGLAIDPALAGSTARLWVGSFADSFITPIDVTLVDPVPVMTFAGGFQHRISGATP